VAEFNQNVQPLTSLANRLADVVIQSQRPRLVLQLPNLRVNQIYVARMGVLEVEFGARIENDGLRDSGPFTMLTYVTRDGQQQPTQTDRIDNLPAQTTQDLTLVRIATDQEGLETICVRVYLDPPTRDNPAGEVLETNILDNLSQSECFDVYFLGV
jgi:hypothetical protein